MTPTASQLAHVLAGTGYDRQDVVDVIRREYPSEDAEAITDAAIAAVAEQDTDLDRAVERDEQAAIAAEHDVSTTMHQEGE
jgi:hypothetical protein